MTAATIDASAGRSASGRWLVVATFGVVAVAFSRISESLEGSSSIIPISAVLALIAIGAALLSRRERRVARPMVAVASALAALQLAVASFSAIGAADPHASIDAIGGQLACAVLFLAMVVLVDTPSRLERALSAIVVTTLVVASVSCVQVLTGSYEATYGGLARAKLAALGEGEGWRLGGPVGDPNFFAQVLAVGVAISLVRLVAARHAGRRGGLALAASGVGMVTLFLTYSRGGLLALGVALLVVGMRWLRWRALPAAVAIGFLVIALAPDSMVDRFSTAAEDAPKAMRGEPVPDTALNGRASEAIVAVRAFNDHPLLGIGIGNYPVHYLDYARHIGLDVRGEERGASSIVLETMAEMGVIGLGTMALTALLAFAAISSLRGESRGEDRVEPRSPLWWSAVAVEAGLIAHLGSALVLPNAYPRGLWLMIGLALACGQVRRASAPVPAA
jgi:O-antigen ligase